MFSKIVKTIFEEFSKTNNFLLNTKDENHVALISKDIDILITYDNRENEVYIDFNLIEYFKLKKYPNELQFPLYLNINALCSRLQISTSSFHDIKNSTLEDRIKIKYAQLVTVWDQIMQRPDHKDVLSNALIQERNKLRAAVEIEKQEKVLRQANDLFKEKNYKHVADLLSPHKERLNEYYKKILDYSLKKNSN